MARNVLGLAKSYRQLARVPALVGPAAASEINALLAAGFAGGTDPYGQGWAPLSPRTLRKHGPPPLTDSGALRGSARVLALPSGLKLGGTPGYGDYHMSGTSRMPKRRWFPDAGLPASWREAIQNAFSRLCREAMQ